MTRLHDTAEEARQEAPPRRKRRPRCRTFFAGPPRVPCLRAHTPASPCPYHCLHGGPARAPGGALVGYSPFPSIHFSSTRLDMAVSCAQRESKSCKKKSYCRRRAFTEPPSATSTGNAASTADLHCLPPRVAPARPPPPACFRSLLTPLPLTQHSQSERNRCSLLLLLLLRNAVFFCEYCLCQGPGVRAELGGDQHCCDAELRDETQLHHKMLLPEWCPGSRCHRCRAPASDAADECQGHQERLRLRERLFNALVRDVHDVAGVAETRQAPTPSKA